MHEAPLKAGRGDLVGNRSDCLIPAHPCRAAVGYTAEPTRVFHFEGVREAHRVMGSSETKGGMVVVL